MSEVVVSVEVVLNSGGAVDVDVSVQEVFPLLAEGEVDNSVVLLGVDVVSLPKGGVLVAKLDVSPVAAIEV